MVHMRKPKTAPETNLASLSKARLKELIEEAVVDAYTEEEQIVGFLTMIEEHLALPFSVKILGVEVEVEKVDMTLDSQIVAFFRRGNTRQKVAILDDLPLPVPAPAGAEWIAASCSRDEYPGDQRADWPGRARDSLAACNAGALEFSRCHVGVMRIVTNGGKWQQKLKREREC